MHMPPKKYSRLFLYDSLDRVTGVNATQLFYNQTRLATEVEGERTNRLFEYDAQPLALQQNSTTCTLLATDMQTSVLQSVRTDGTQQALAYTPYGHQKDLKTLPGVCGFNGERPDPLTGHYLLGQGYRAFNPVLMRFNSPDNLSPFAEGGINAYGYCGGDPINRVDPTGHFFSKVSRLLNRGFLKADAFFTGSHVKKVHKLTRLSDGIIAFEDTFKNKRRLNFVGHGQMSNGKARMLFDESQPIDAWSLVNLTGNNGIEVKDYSYLRTIMCNSATGDSQSFGATLHAITGRPVKSFKGIVNASDPDKLIPPLKPGEMSTHNSLIQIGKNKNLWRYAPKGLKDNYEPVTFGTEIRTA